MDASRFDAWTRRRFGLAAGSALAALGLAGVGNVADVVAKKKKKKRCMKRGRACNPGGKKKCCGKLACDSISFEEDPQTRCCSKLGKGCVDNADCCANLCCDTDANACSNLCAI